MQKVIPLQTGYTMTGEYGIELVSGTMAAGLAADSEIYQFRWTAAKVCPVAEVSMWAGTLTTFTQGAFAFRLFPARSWTVDGAGGSAATLTTNNGKLRTSFPTTAVGAARISSTAALTAGTKTLDAQGIESCGGGTVADGAAVVNLNLPRTYLLGGGAGARYPLLLAQNEGFVIRASVPATGTWIFGVTVRYEETGGYRL